MNIEFYVQGKPEDKDGEMVLSLTEEAMDKLICHQNLKTKATEEIIKNIQEKRIIKPEEMAKYIEDLRQEGEYLIRINSGEKENPILQKRLSLCQVARVLYSQAKICSDEKRDLIICHEDLEFKSQTQQIKTPDLGQRKERYCIINKAVIEQADTEKDKYAGIIDWTEKIGSNDPREDKWIMYKIPKTVCSKKNFNIRAKILNDTINVYKFSMISEIDLALKEYIDKTIERYKKQ
jgi:hypothetical protein